MNEVITTGVDLAKNVFQVHGFCAATWPVFTPLLTFTRGSERKPKSEYEMVEIVPPQPFTRALERKPKPEYEMVEIVPSQPPTYPVRPENSPSALM